jgi:hypothetical protein
MKRNILIGAALITGATLLFAADVKTDYIVIPSISASSILIHG